MNIWSWCRAGRHRDCRHGQRFSEGTWSCCACWCHRSAVRANSERLLGGAPREATEETTMTTLRPA